MGTPRPLVIVTRRLPDEVDQALAASFEVRLNLADEPFGEARLRRALADSDGLLCTLTDDLHPGLFAGPGPRCRILANFGVGVNHIAVTEARRAGLCVTNTPDVLTECTADLTLALILMACRRLGEGERDLRAGRWTGWSPMDHLGRRVSGRTLGIVGFGRIGQAVAHRASRGFGMKVLAWGPRPAARERLAAVGAAWAESLEQLLGAADLVSLHCPLAADTAGLINAARLGQMVPGAILINTARGEIVDEAALVTALRDGHLGGAGLDVFRGEPRVAPELLALPNVVLLPHLGSATLETRTAMGLRAVENLRAFFRSEDPPDRVG